MSLNEVVSAERLQIGFFGLRNAGKSSLMNAITGQELSLVSEVLGTTTDPVKKAMELLPLGPVVLIDTPGLDDEGTLGEMRVKRARDVLQKVDVAVLVTDATRELAPAESELIDIFRERMIPYIIACNKSDRLDLVPENTPERVYVSALKGDGINELKDAIGRLAKNKKGSKGILDGIVREGDHLLLVIPIDGSAPKGRLILPQQMVLREALDRHLVVSACQVEELPAALGAVKPDLVITDSQAFGKVSGIVPDEVKLTSFSILMARYKGELSSLIEGADALSGLGDGDRVLISEGCTHHRQCQDIGTVKMPAWIREYTGKDPSFEFSSGGGFPEDLSGLRLIVHCGGCMLTEREMKLRLEKANAAGVPVVNYGVAIAAMKGILERSLRVFG